MGISRLKLNVRSHVFSLFWKLIGLLFACADRITICLRPLSATMMILLYILCATRVPLESQRKSNGVWMWMVLLMVTLSWVGMYEFAYAYRVCVQVRMRMRSYFS